MSAVFHDADRPDDPCNNPDCADCNPETWDDDYDGEPAWWWPWSIALLAAIVAVAIVLATGAPRP